MLDEVKGHVSDDEALRTVSSMLNKTIQAMNQLKVVRKHTVCLKTFDGKSLLMTNTLCLS